MVMGEGRGETNSKHQTPSNREPRREGLRACGTTGPKARSARRKARSAERRYGTTGLSVSESLLHFHAIKAARVGCGGIHERFHRAVARHHRQTRPVTIGE